MVKRKGDNTATAFTTTTTTINSDSPILPLFDLTAQALTMFLPFHATLKDGKRVIVNRVTDHQVTDVFLMIQEAAISGDGYGVDEFPTEKDFLRDVHHDNGKIFNVCDHDSGNTLAAFVIMDSKYYRGQSTVADSYIVVKREERRKGLGEFCMKMILEFTRRLGYVCIYSDTFNDNIPMRKIIEQSGFQKVGFLPMSARMPDGSVKPSVIYYRDLSAVSSHLSQLDAGGSSLIQGAADSLCIESDTLPS